MRFRFPCLILGICLLAVSASVRADDSPKYAERGRSAYYAGKYDLARLFFAKALQDAILKGKEEWVAKATLNLVDVDLEALEEGEAGRLLEGLSTRDKGLRSLIIWKRSQLAYQQRRFPEAIVQVDSAIGFAKGDPIKELGMRIDRLRYLIQSQSPSAWETEFANFQSQMGRMDRGRMAGLLAMAAMARRDFTKADTLWREAMNYYRDQGRLAKVAACLNQSAICQFSSGHREEAKESNSRAVAIYSELGLELPGLRAQALRLILVEDPRELAKLRQDLDLLGQRFSGFDLQGILDGYSQSMHFGRIGTEP
jgi:tetratricopeptide (TPR) repeat protein